MSINILDKKQCDGCAVCCNICPKKCITMVEDGYGFLYPSINRSDCIECGLCEKVCPITSCNTLKSEVRSVYAAWSKDSEIRYSSTSGGIFSELALQVLSKSGYVSAAAYDENNIIHHVLINDKNELENLRQSKYAQSRMDDIYEKIKIKLQDNTTVVLFCGTPCQVAGLKSFLQKTYSNLITIDFICRGVNSPKALREWIGEMEHIHNSKVRRIWFKYKIDGWKNSPKCTRIDFQNGNSIVKKEKDNSFMYGYLGPNLYIRPCCGSCKFKGKNRCADITLGDFWGINSHLDDDKGTSLVLINSIYGNVLFEDVKSRIEYSKRKLDEILDGNVCFNNSIKINPKSEEFFKILDLKKESFSKLVYRYSKKSIFEKSKNIMKGIINILQGRLK